jgi:photosystem II stability/assembly factor-like uncharacterized protein
MKKGITVGLAHVSAVQLLMCAVLLIGLPSTALSQGHSGWAVGESVDGYATIVHTRDSGVHWERQGSPEVVPDVMLNGISATDVRTAWAVGESDQGYGTILHTRNGGITWERQGGPGEIPDVAFGKVKAVDAKVVWVVGTPGIVLRTLDGGETWTQLGADVLPNILFQGLYVLDIDTAWVGGDPVDDEGSVFFTSDGGVTWVRFGAANGLPQQSHFLGISAADADTVWAVGGGGYLVYHTRDGGDSWVLQEGHPGDMQDGNEVCALDQNTAWVAMDNDRILFTQDGGQTWLPRGPNPSTGRYMMSISAITPEIVWAAGTGERPPVGVIVHTEDGGLNWEVQDYPGGGNLWNISMISGFLDETYVVPAVALTEGAEGSFFVTDLEINNAGASAMTFRLTFVPRGAGKISTLVSDNFTLNAGRSVRYDNVLSGLFGLDSGVGAVVMTCTSDTAILMSRTFTQTDNGTYGQSIPGYHTSRLNSGPGPVRILFMTENGEYRSNLGIMNATDAENHITYELFDAHGVSLGTGDVTLQAWGNTQVNRVLGEGANVDAAYIDVWSETEGGLFTCYGSVLDNLSNDPTTVPPM